MRNRLTALAAGLAFAIAVGGVAAIGASRDDRPPRLPRLGATAGEATARLSAPSDAALGDQVQYVPAGPLPDLPSRAPAYRLTRPSQADVSRLTAALGLRGTLTVRGDWWSESNATHQVSGSFSGGGRWHYAEHRGCPSVPPASPGDGPPEAVDRKASASCVVASPDTPTSSPPADAPPESSASSPPPDARAGACKPCPPGRYCAQVCQIEPLPNLPARQAAEATARQFLQRAGVDTTTAGVRVDGGYASWSVRFAPRLGDLFTEGLEATVEVGPGDTVLSASGWLGRPERLGTYPLVSAARALDRLNEPPEPPAGAEPGRGRPEPMPMPMPMPEPDSGGTEPMPSPRRQPGTAPPSPPAADTPPPDAGTPPPSPPYDATEPVPLLPTGRRIPPEQTVTGARLVLLVVPHDEVTYLVPAVVFELYGDPNRTAPPVPAVTERHLLPLGAATGSQLHR